MSSSRTRKTASVTLMVVALVGLQSARALGTGMGGQEVRVGAATAEACGNSEVAVDYIVEYDFDLQGYGVSAAELSGLDARCLGYEVIVSLNGPGGVQLAEMTTAVEATRMRVAVPARTPVAAEQLTGVSIVLSGTEA